MGCSSSKTATKDPANKEPEAQTLPTLQAGAKQEAEKQHTHPGKGKALIVSTSACAMGHHTTGAWSEEICGPYYVFQDAGYEVTVCSIAGGDIPIDAGSLTDQFKTENDKKMIEAGCTPLKGTSALADVDVLAYDIVFFAGGNGACVDFPTHAVGAAVSKALDGGKVVAAVCHGSMALVHAKTADGKPLVEGKKICCFTNEEEKQIGLTEKVPFLLATKLAELGAVLESAEPWSDRAVQDGRLVTGQNPQSSVSVAKLAIAAISPSKEEAENVEPIAEVKAEGETIKAEGETIVTEVDAQPKSWGCC